MHFFNSPKPGKLVGKLNWRIKEPDGEFFTRDVVQKFAQDPKNPAHLVNKDNDYLHYRGKMVFCSRREIDRGTGRKMKMA